MFKSPCASRKAFKQSFRNDKSTKHHSMVGQMAIKKNKKNKKKNKSADNNNTNSINGVSSEQLHEAVNNILNGILKKNDVNFNAAAAAAVAAVAAGAKKANDPSYPEHLINPPNQPTNSRNDQNNVVVSSMCNQFKTSLNINLRFVVIDGSNVAIE